MHAGLRWESVDFHAGFVQAIKARAKADAADARARRGLPSAVLSSDAPRREASNSVGTAKKAQLAKDGGSTEQRVNQLTVLCATRSLRIISVFFRRKGLRNLSANS